MLSKDEEEEILEMLPNDEEAEELDFHHDQNGDNDDRLQPVNSNSNRQRRRRRSVAVWSVLALVISCVVISVVVVWTNRGLQKKKNNATATVTNGIGEDKYEYDENDNGETETTNKKEIENSNSLYLSTDHPTTVPPTVSPTVPSDEPRQQECPPKSTKPTDNDNFSREKLTSAGCVPLDCLSELELRNTRDRLGPLAHLCKGQALCNGDAEKYPGTIFQFGLSENGSLVWQQCNPSDPSQTEVRVLREGNEKSDQVWFTMTAIGTWQIWESSSSSSPSSLVDATTAPNATTVTTATNEATPTPSLVWTQSVDDEQNISGEIRRCLHSRPVLDCPYLHFRRHGAVVLNYIDDQGSWVACDCQKSCFPGLWQNN